MICTKSLCYFLFTPPTIFLKYIICSVSSQIRFANPWISAMPKGFSHTRIIFLRPNQQAIGSVMNSSHYILTYILYSTHFIRKNQAFLPKNAWFFVLFSKKYTCFNRLCKRENRFFIFFFFILIQISFIKMILHFLFFICADLC